MALLVANNIHNCCLRQQFLRQWGSSQKCNGSRYLRKRSRGVVFAAIGFAPDPRVQIERIADGLLKDVAALLVYQEVFRSPPAQAFLKLLFGISRRTDGKILESYGEFFKLMASGQHSSWEDFLLEAILQAEGNPFAEAAAGIGNPDSAFGGELPASLEAAAVSDLETLQKLSINESTLTGWVTELVPTAKDQWRNAASSNLSCRSVRKIKPSTDGEPEEKASLDITDNCEKPIRKNTDFVISEREQWQKKLGGLWKWSEAVPLLKEYHSHWGFGRVTTSQVMKLRGGRLVPDFNYLKEISRPDLAVWSKQQEDLYKNLKRHVSQSSGRHLFLHGPSGSGKSYLLRSTLQELSEEARFRVLIVPSTETKQLNTLLEEFRRNVNIFFFLVIEDLFLRAAEETFLLLKATFDDSLEEWPKNVLLCATSSRSEAQIGGSMVKLSDIFGMSLALTKLEQEQYLKCVDEILQYKLQKSELTLSQNETDIQQNAIKWGQEAGFSVKSAAAFAEDALQSD